MNKTKLPNLCYGELIRSTSSTLQTDELLQKPLAGCFDHRRCVYAIGAEEEPIPKSGVPGGAVEPPRPPPKSWHYNSHAEDEIALQLAIDESLKEKGPLRAPPVETIAPAKRSAPRPDVLTMAQVTQEMIDAVDKPDEVIIANMYVRGINRS